MQSIGDIMQEMQITTQHQPAVAHRNEYVEKLKARLQEYSCSQLSEEDYAVTTNPWEEWPYSWACRVQSIVRERLHSFHQNRNSNTMDAEYSAGAEKTENADIEYSCPVARAA